MLLCKPAFIALVTCEPSPGGVDKMRAAACMAMQKTSTHKGSVHSFSSEKLISNQKNYPTVANKTLQDVPAV